MAKLKSNSKARRPVGSAAKKVSIKEVVSKAVGKAKELIKGKPEKKKPFGGKGGRKRKPPKLDADKQAELDRIKEDADLDAGAEQSSAQRAAAEHPASAFFYSDEKAVASFDDAEIIEFIAHRFPEFEPGKADEQRLRKAVIDMLSDDDFVSRLLSRFGFSVYDFFRFLYRSDSSIFHGVFLQRVQRTVKGRKYARVRQPNYKFRSIAKHRAEARAKARKASHEGRSAN